MPKGSTIPEAHPSTLDTRHSTLEIVSLDDVVQGDLTNPMGSPRAPQTGAATLLTPAIEPLIEVE